jgi:hypothetical protein
MNSERRERQRKRITDSIVQGISQAAALKEYYSNE